MPAQTVLMMKNFSCVHSGGCGVFVSTTKLKNSRFFSFQYFSWYSSPSVSRPRDGDCGRSAELLDARSAELLEDRSVDRRCLAGDGKFAPRGCAATRAMVSSCPPR